MQPRSSLSSSEVESTYIGKQRAEVTGKQRVEVRGSVSSISGQYANAVALLGEFNSATDAELNTSCQEDDDRVVNISIRVLGDATCDVATRLLGAKVLSRVSINVKAYNYHRVTWTLISALHDDNVAIRIEAVEALEKFGCISDDVIEALLTASWDESDLVRDKVVIALGALGQREGERSWMPEVSPARQDKIIIDRLVAMLKDSSQLVCQEALVTLCNKFNQGTDVIVNAFNRFTEAEQLRFRGFVHSYNIAASLPPLPSKVWVWLKKTLAIVSPLFAAIVTGIAIFLGLNPLGFPLVFGVLFSFTVSALIFAIILMVTGFFKKPKVVIQDNPTSEELVNAVKNVPMNRENMRTTLLEALHSENPRTREAAIVALGHLGCADEQVIAALRAILGNSPTCDINLAFAFGRLGYSAEERILAALINALTYANLSIFVNAVLILSKLGCRDGRLIAVLIVMLRNSYLSKAAAEALVVLRCVDEAVINELIACCDNDDSNVRNNAAMALGKLGHIDANVATRLVDLLQTTPVSEETYGVRYEDANKLIITLIKAVGSLGGAVNSAIIVALVNKFKNADFRIMDLLSDALVELCNTHGCTNCVLNALLEILEQDNNIFDLVAEVLNRLNSVLIEDVVVIARLFRVVTREVRSHEEGEVRFYVAALLAVSGKSNEATLKILYGELQSDTHNYSYGKIMAAEALFALNRVDEHVIATLCESLCSNDDHHIRIRAAKILGSLRPVDHRVVAALVNYVQDHVSDYDRRKDKADKPKVLAIIAVAEELLDLGKTDQYVVDALVNALNSKAFHQIGGILGKLARTNTDLVPILIKLLNSSNDHVVAGAAVALMKSNVRVNTELLAILEKLLSQDRPNYVVRNINDILAKSLCLYPRYYSLYRGCPDSDEERNGVGRLAKRLGELGCADSKIINSLMVGPTYYHHFQAEKVRTLGKLNCSDERVMSFLLKISQSRNVDFETREWAHAALMHLCTKKYGVMALMDICGNSNSETWSFVTGVLVEAVQLSKDLVIAPQISVNASLGIPRLASNVNGFFQVPAAQMVDNAPQNSAETDSHTTTPDNF